MFLIASAHISKSLPEKVYTVTGIIGRAFVSYTVAYGSMTPQNKHALSYTRQSAWLPLRVGMQIGRLATIKTDAGATVDIMKAGLFSIRLEENTQISMSGDSVEDSRHLIENRIGKVICKVLPEKDRSNKEKIVVKTEDAAIVVQGTVFSVDYQPEGRATDICVLKGAIGITPQNEHSALTYTAASGEKVCYKDDCLFPAIKKLSAKEKSALENVQALKTDYSQAEQWEKYMTLVTNSPLYRKALKIITDYEIKIFKRAIIYKARLLWNNTVPEKLTAIELEDGDYADPWGTNYYYEKLSKKDAVIISAGEDKILHSNDDIFVAIRL